MNVSGYLKFVDSDENEKRYRFEGEQCFGFMWNIVSLSKDSFREVLDLKTVHYDLEHGVSDGMLDLVKSIPFFDIFDVVDDHVVINVNRYQADRVIFTLQFIRNLKDEPDTFLAVCAKYKPVIGFIMHFIMLSESFDGMEHLLFEYCSDSSVFDPSIMLKEDYVAVLEHTDGREFTNQGKFNEQGGYVKGYNFRGKEYLESLGFSYKQFLIEGYEPNNEYDFERKDGCSECGYDNYEQDYGHDKGMMFAWKQDKRRGQGIRALNSQVRNSMHHKEEYNTMELCIDAFISRLDLSPSDYKIIEEIQNEAA